MNAQPIGGGEIDVVQWQMNGSFEAYILSQLYTHRDLGTPLADAGSFADRGDGVSLKLFGVRDAEENDEGVLFPIRRAVVSFTQEIGELLFGHFVSYPIERTPHPAP